jgi:ornithine cyclodeaminase/alanine dehydrogenase-like protein (mu-crystallin family)
LQAILDACKTLKKVKIYDLYQGPTQRLSQEMSQAFKLNAHPVDTMEAALRGSDIVCVSTAGTGQPMLKDE